MPITDVPKLANFAGDYDKIGRYFNDGSEVKWWNSLATMLQPGEPFLIQYGAAAAEQCMFNKDVCHPGEWATLIKPGYWAAVLPCTLSATVVLGQELYWDFTDGEVALTGDVVNGWIIGDAGIAIDPNETAPEDPAVDGNGRVIAGTTASTSILIISRIGPTTTKGTVVIN